MNVIGVERDKQGVPYALLANEAGYQGAAFIGLPGCLRSAFWRYVEGQTVTDAPIVGLKKKSAWLRPGMTAKVRYPRGSDKMRHAVVQSVKIER